MAIRSNSSSSNSRRPLPQVADRETSPGQDCPDTVVDLSFNHRTEELVHVDQYKVFLKRNLKPIAAPAAPLDKILARAAEIKASGIDFEL